MNTRAQTVALALAIFASGFCGMLAEYSISTMVSYLIGDSMKAYSIIIGVFMFAMGLGAYGNQRFAAGKELSTFLVVEILLGTLVAASTTTIAASLQIGAVWPTAIFFAASIGFLIGMEIPLLMRFNESRGLVLSENAAKVLFFDYLGSFVAGITYSLYFIPTYGTITTPVISGTVNLFLAAVVAVAFREIGAKPVLLGIAASLVTALFGTYGEQIAFSSERIVFRDPIVYSEQTSYQRIVISQKNDRMCLFLNAGTQFCSNDERRYHEMLVHPAFHVKQDPRRVLVLGGGDGLALREILKYDSVEVVTLVDLDPRMTELSSTHDYITTLNEHSFDDPRVNVVHGDAFTWVRQSNEHLWDIIIVDLPDPRRVELAKLYSMEFYRMLRHSIVPDGVVTVQSTSPLHARDVFVGITATMQAAGLSAQPYRVNIPSFGDWGFNIATRDDYMPVEEVRATLDTYTPTVPVSIINQDFMQASSRFEQGILPHEGEYIPVSRLARPTIHTAYKNAWRNL